MFGAWGKRYIIQFCLLWPVARFVACCGEGWAVDFGFPRVPHSTVWGVKSFYYNRRYRIGNLCNPHVSWFYHWIGNARVFVVQLKHCFVVCKPLLWSAVFKRDCLKHCNRSGENLCLGNFRALGWYKFWYKKRKTASEIAFRSQKSLAGAEGLEPSARGFGATVENAQTA